MSLFEAGECPHFIHSLFYSLLHSFFYSSLHSLFNSSLQSLYYTLISHTPSHVARRHTIHSFHTLFHLARYDTGEDTL